MTETQNKRSLHEKKKRLKTAVWHVFTNDKLHKYVSFSTLGEFQEVFLRLYVHKVKL